MKYRHANHAGNFADVVKHFTLVEMLMALTQKTAPLFYMETHAGRGRYKLSTAEAQGLVRDIAASGNEFLSGFGRLSAAAEVPAILVPYMDLARKLGTAADGAPEAYPGSPLLAGALLRATDRAALFEIQNVEAQLLHAALEQTRFPARVVVHAADGYAALRAQLPPRERRGLVLIDPAYEVQEKEFTQLLQALTDAHGRWPTGVYAIWYPIKRRAAIDAFHASLRDSGIRRILCAELCLFPDDSRVSLNGCGMLLVNPPWKLDAALEPGFTALHRLFGGLPGTAARVSWLVPE